MNGEDGWIKWIKLMMQKAREAREIIEEIDEDIFDHLNIANDVLFIIKDFVNGEVSSRDLTNRLGGIAGECLGGYIGGKLLGMNINIKRQRAIYNVKFQARHVCHLKLLWCFVIISEKME